MTPNKPTREDVEAAVQRWRVLYTVEKELRKAVSQAAKKVDNQEQLMWKLADEAGVSRIDVFLMEGCSGDN